MGKAKTKGNLAGRESALGSFEELAEKASSAIMSALIEGGGKAFKSSVYMWLSHAVLWDQRKRWESSSAPARPPKLKPQMIREGDSRPTRGNS